MDDQNDTGKELERLRRRVAELEIAAGELVGFRDAMTDGMAIFDARLCFVDANQVALHNLGASRQEVVGRHLLDLLPGYRDSDRYDEFLAVLRSGEPAVLEDWVDLPGTGRRCFSTRVFPLGAGLGVIGTDVTEQRLAEERLLAREERFRMLTEQTSDWVWEVDENAVYTYVSPQVEKLLGYTPEQIVGKTPFDLMPPEEAERVGREFGAIAEQPRPFANLENTNRHRDGRLVVLETSGVPIFDQQGELRGFRGIDRDISERKAAEQLLRQYRQRLEEQVAERTAERALAAERELLAVTLRSIGDGVIVTDPAGTVLSVNRVAEELTGWSQREAAGKPLGTVFRIIDEQTRRPVEDPVSKVLQTGLVIGLANHTILVTRDGTERSIADSCAPIRDQDSVPRGVVLVFRDVTEKLRVERELQKVQKLESVGVLAGGIAHDFNNILTSILGNIGFAKLVLEPGHEIWQSLDDAEKASWRARDLTQQLLTFSRGGAPIKKPASLEALVRDAARFSLRGTKAGCRVHCSEQLWSAEVDHGQINQVFNNLLINASQAMPEGGTVTVSLENLAVRPGAALLLEPGRYVHVAVTDQGVGISPRHLPKIFDPYFTTKQRGSGLGLAVSHSVVERHGGALRAESELGRGSTFHVYLPALAHQAPLASSREPELRMGRGRVLVMDDEAAIRQLFGNLLSSLGYDCALAAEGREAVELYRAAAQEKGEPFDAVILDLTVPGGMGGREALRELVEIDADVKAIVSSGYSNDEVVAEFAEHGFRAAIAKPFGLAQLSKVLAEVVVGS